MKDSNFAKCLFHRLWRLYNNLEPNSPLRYHVYYHVIELAARVGFVREVFTGVEQLRKEFANCPPSNEQMQKLYRLLHQVLKDQNRYVLTTLNLLKNDHIISMSDVPKSDWLLRKHCY